MAALSHITILDLTHMLSGPYAGMLFADMGARTIKIEPLSGEGTRKLLAESKDYSIDGMGAYFLTLNRNKESVALDLKSEEGLSIFYELVKKADVVINNFSRGVPARLKIDYDTLAAINSNIITCSITGFGETGPDTDRPAFDLVAQGVGGGMSITGEEEENPLALGFQLVI
jgi:crotonobetainyl-CoA:carnitine CoA-transferase CaiB-like acyl-CoA transferase